jgi:hypothetical protein
MYGNVWNTKKKLQNDTEMYGQLKRNYKTTAEITAITQRQT